MHWSIISRLILTQVTKLLSVSDQARIINWELGIIALSFLAIKNYRAMPEI